MKLSVYKKIFAHGKIKSGRKFFVKKKRKKEKKTGLRKKGWVPFCREINKKFLCESDWNWRKELAVKLNFATNNVKN